MLHLKWATKKSKIRLHAPSCDLVDIFHCSHLSWLALVTLLSACISSPSTQLASTQSVPIPIGSCSLELPETTPTNVVIQAVLSAEGQFVVEQNIDGLMQLWANDSRISDAKHTPDDQTDDQTWQGQDAIRNRYVRWVFPGAPSMAQPSDVKIAINGDEAMVTSTTQIGDEVSPDGDQWTLKEIDGCWVIAELVFNLEDK